MAKRNKKDDPVDLVFVGILFIGVGTGFLLNNVLIGVLFGLGLGFIGKLVTQTIMKKTK